MKEFLKRWLVSLGRSARGVFNTMLILVVIFYGVNLVVAGNHYSTLVPNPIGNFPALQKVIDNTDNLSTRFGTIESLIVSILTKVNNLATELNAVKIAVEAGGGGVVAPSKKQCLADGIWYDSGNFYTFYSTKTVDGGKCFGGSRTCFDGVWVGVSGEYVYADCTAWSYTDWTPALTCTYTECFWRYTKSITQTRIRTCKKNGVVVNEAVCIAEIGPGASVLEEFPNIQCNDGRFSSPPMTPGVTCLPGSL